MVPYANLINIMVHPDSMFVLGLQHSRKAIPKNEPVIQEETADPHAGIPTTISRDVRSSGVPGNSWK